MKKFGHIILLIALFATTSAMAQFTQRDVNRNAKNGTPSLGAGLQVMTPQAEYNQTLDEMGGGFYFMFMKNLGRSPIEVGAKASFLQNGSQSDDVYMYSGDTVDGDEVYEEVDMKAKSTIRQYMGIARLEPLKGKVQLYGDLMAGYTNYGLRTKITSNDELEEKLASDRVYNKAGFTYGWGAGLKIQLTHGLMVEGRFENLRGQKTMYVDPNSVSIGREGEVDYDLLESKTDMFNFHLGLSIEF